MSERVFCPAGRLSLGVVPQKTGCYCKIEEFLITETSPSLRAHCMDRYTLCPTWRNHKQDEWRDKEEWVKARRKEKIEEQFGPEDDAADAFMNNEADIDALFE